MGAHGVLVGRDRKKETATIRFDDDDLIETIEKLRGLFGAAAKSNDVSFDLLLVRRAPERWICQQTPLSPSRF